MFLNSAFLGTPSEGPSGLELWMFSIFAAGGLVLDGADELLRLPTPLRALGLVLCIYALGAAVGWGLQQAGGDFPWDASARGFAADGRMRLEQAPYWFGLALFIRPVRHLMDRIQAALIAPAPAVAARRHAPQTSGAATVAQ
jgi:hypothetical protein